MLIDHALDDAPYLGVAELSLGLAFELGVGHLDADDRAEALSRVRTVEGGHTILHQTRGLSVRVEAAGEPPPEAGEMAAPILGVDVVRVGVDVLRIAVVPLHGDVHEDALALPADHDRDRWKDGLVPVQVLDKRRDAPVILETVLFVVPLVGERDQDAAVQEAELPQAPREGVEAERGRLEDLGVGLEGDPCSAPVGDARALERSLWPTTGVQLAVDSAVAEDLELEALRQRVDDRDAHAMESTRHLVDLLVELAAGVQLGHHDLGCVDVWVRGMRTDRDATAIVNDRHRVVDVDRDVDLGTVAREGLVDRVVNDLIDEVVEASLAGGADVHGGPHAHGLEALENSDGIDTVLAGCGSGFVWRHLAHG